MDNKAFKKYIEDYEEYIFELIKKGIFDQIYAITSTQVAQPYETRKIGAWGIDVTPEDIFRMERSKKWFNEFIKPLQEKGFRVRQLP